MTPGARSRPRPEPAAIVAALVDAIHAAIAQSTGRSGEDIRSDIAALVEPPAALYLDHVYWPSNLAGLGVPLELSLALDGQGRPSFRCAADLADHRRRLAGNWRRYLDAAVAATGASRDMLWHLFNRHTAVNPPTLRSPVYHGLGYGASARRSSIYFFIGGLNRAQFGRQFAAETAAIDASLAGRRPDRYHGVAYDFDEQGKIYRTKFYAWLDLDEPLGELSAAIGPGHGLIAAQRLLDHLTERVGPRTESRCTLLQSSLAARRLTCGHKLFINCEAWKLDRPKVLLDAVSDLSATSEIDLSPLAGVLSVFSAADISLLPLWIAVGPGRKPAVTFYFAPVLDRGTDDRATAPASIRAMVRRGLGYLSRQRRRDGSWRDPKTGDPAELVTSRVAMSLTGLNGLAPDLGITAAWLRDRLALEPLKSSTEAALQARVALSRLGTAGRRRTLVASADQTPDFVGLELLLRMESGRWSEGHGRLMERLRHSERWIGGWSGMAEDIAVTTRVVEALRAVASRAPERWQQRATSLIDRAAYIYSEHPVPCEPFHIACWLKGSVLCGHDLTRPPFARAIAHLASSQQPDGRWLATPFEEASGRRAYMDPACLTTTAAIVEALGMVHERLLE